MKLKKIKLLFNMRVIEVLYSMKIYQEVTVHSPVKDRSTQFQDDT